MDQPTSTPRGITIPHHWLRILLIAAAGALALFLANLAVEGYRGYGFISGGGEAATIDVSGSGEIKAVPDMAKINVSVSSLAGTAKVAQDILTTKVANVMAVIRQNGIADTDIELTNYSVDTDGCYNYDSRYSPQNCSASDYTGTQTVTVTVKNVSTLQSLLNSIGSKGGEIQYVSLSSSEDKKLRDEAQQKAVADAREKARRIADNLGVSLGRVVSFNDYNDYSAYSEPVSLYVNYGSGNSVVPTIPAGEQSITAQVTVTFEVH